MAIFETYTGNSMLNNALMTIEALENLQNVSGITPEILMKLYNEPIKGYSLIELNQRFKNYTMLFTKNGPLHNDKKFGLKIYDGLMKRILNNFEKEGENACEITGMKYNKDFDTIFKEVLQNIGFPAKDILKKDTTLNRCWFPLIGGLGSDAQALPQAKFSLKIHPICIVIMQFLPLSALLYKGGVLLVDSSNFEFTRTYIKSNTDEVIKRIALIQTSDSVENIKDFSKGNYLLKALKVLDEKEMDDDYSDLNLWSFTNSGTGASCEIDRIPNSLIQKLIQLKNNSEIKNELISIIEDKNVSGNFLSALEDNQEWYRLYPAKKYDGVSVPFMETYLKIIGSEQKVKIAKYLAYLIAKYKSKSFEKYLSKTDAYIEKEYRIDLYSVLLKATEHGEWNLTHQLQVLDSLDAFPVRSTTYNIHKITHYFYQKQVFIENSDSAESEYSETVNVCKWLIALIQNDSNSKAIIKRLLNPQEYQSIGYSELILRSAYYSSSNLQSIFYALYDSTGKPNRFGLNELLRVFFSQPEQEKHEVFELKQTNTIIEKSYHDWFSKINDFANDYQAYYFDKYENKSTGTKPYNKYLDQVNSISNENIQFLHWFNEAVENTNAFLRGETLELPDKWIDDLLFNPQGEFAIAFARLAIQFSLRKMYYHSIAQQNITIKTL